MPAGTTMLSVTNITIMEDDVNEKEEVFVLVAKILGPAADKACFQLDENSDCKRNASIGGSRLRIRDNDGT